MPVTPFEIRIVLGGDGQGKGNLGRMTEMQGDGEVEGSKRRQRLAQERKLGIETDSKTDTRGAGGEAEQILAVAAADLQGIGNSGGNSQLAFHDGPIN